VYKDSLHTELKVGVVKLEHDHPKSPTHGP
jgi:hypothetical protein